MASTLPLLGWWLLVLALLVTLLRVWYRSRARISRWEFPAIATAVVAICAVGMALPYVLATPFVAAGKTAPLTCQTDADVRICVTSEQQPMLATVAREAQIVVDRMGQYFPPQITTIASSKARRSLEVDGVKRSEIITVNVSTTGAPTVKMDIGVGLAGLGACTPAESDQRAITWAFDLGTWIAGTTGDSWALDPLRIKLDHTPEERVLTWYAQYVEEILDCRYIGDGPS